MYGCIVIVSAYWCVRTKSTVPSLVFRNSKIKWKEATFENEYYFRTALFLILKFQMYIHPMNTYDQQIVYTNCLLRLVCSSSNEISLIFNLHYISPYTGYIQFSNYIISIIKFTRIMHMTQISTLQPIDIRTGFLKALVKYTHWLS